MKQIVPVVLLASLVSCASTPNLEPIDNALLIEASSAGRSNVTEARAARDASEDAYAAARRETSQAEAQIDVARAALKTVRSQLDESKLAVTVAQSGTTKQLEAAQAEHEFMLARADHARGTLAVRKREFELAKLAEKQALEEHRLSIVMVELKKAEALQDVDLVAAKSISLKDYRRQVSYHREEVETATSRVRTARSRLSDALEDLDDFQRKMDSLKPASN